MAKVEIWLKKRSKPWTNKEYLKLEKLWNEELPIFKIAKLMKRPYEHVYERIWRLKYNGYLKPRKEAPILKPDDEEQAKSIKRYLDREGVEYEMRCKK